MKKTILIILLAALLLCGCGSQGSQAEAWTVPTIEPAPTVQPTAAPGYSGEVRPPESYIWNEAEGFDMSTPGVSVTAAQADVSHDDSMALFGSEFLPSTLFGESYVSYSKLYLRRYEHQILLDESGALAENAYVEYLYVPGDWNEKNGLTVMAELCSYDKVQSIYAGKSYPHIYCAGGATPQSSTYYLQDFILAKLGNVRYAQWLALPSAYYSYVDRVSQEAAAAGTDPSIQPQILLTFTCGSDISDEEFIAAVLSVGQYAANSRVLPSNVKATPAPGEKGAA